MKKCEYCAKEISYFEQYCERYMCFRHSYWNFFIFLFKNCRYDNYTPKLFGAWNYVDFTPFSDRKYDFKA